MNWFSPSTGIAPGLLKQLESLIHRRPKVEIWIAGSEEELTLRKALRALSPTVRGRIKTGTTEAHTYWAQDGSKPLNDGKVLLPWKMDPQRKDRNHYFATQSILQSGLTSSETSRFRFEGGNLNVGDKHLFVGSEIISWTTRDLKISRAEAVAALSVEFGKTVLEVGERIPNFQPLQIDLHNDLWMLVARDRREGPEKILMGSIRKAADILLTKKNDLHGPVSSFTDLFLSHHGRLSEMERHLALGLETVDPNYLIDRQRRLDLATEVLEQRGYEVILLPDFKWPVPEGPRPSLPHAFSYTNLVLSDGVALLPKMGVRKWDQYAKRKLWGLGYESIGFPVAQKGMCRGGGVRCLTEAYRNLMGDESDFRNRPISFREGK